MAKAGRPPRLSREQIVAAVVDLLESQGADAVSTRTVGEALGVHPTALYRHFRDMDELVREAADRILAGLVGDPPWPVRHGGDAVDEVLRISLALRTTLMDHPGAAMVMAPGPSRKPNERAFTERMLELLTAAGLPDDDVVLTYHALVEYVVGSCAVDVAARTRSAGDEETTHLTWREEYTADPDGFPHSSRLADRLYPDQDVQFEFGLRMLVDGLRQRIAAAPVTAGGRA